MGKKRFFLQFENTNGLSIKNPYLNSFVCLLVFIVVSGAILLSFSSIALSTGYI